MQEVVVIGGGVIGLAIAREVARDHSVLLLERDGTGQGTSWAAAGMLSPQSEADDAGPFFQISLAAMRMYRPFAEEIHAESGVDPEYEDYGVLVLASSEEAFTTLKARAHWQMSAGLRAETLSPSEVSKLEPLITADICGGLLLRNDHQVTPRLLTKALAQACLRRKVEIRTGTSVDRVLTRNGRIAGVETSGKTIQADCVIVAGGVWSGRIEGLSPAIPVSPRKGQILSLSMSQRMFHRMIRLGHSYFVPRRDGELVVGATNEEAGFDASLTPAGLGRLLSDAQKISSHVGGLPIRETWVGFRPATPDELPIIGESDIPGLFYATGHYRNGILLAPITASIVGALIRGEQTAISLEPFRPNRFLQAPL